MTLEELVTGIKSYLQSLEDVYVVDYTDLAGEVVFHVNETLLISIREARLFATEIKP